MRSYWPLLLTLAAMWGASYLFIKLAVDDIPPTAIARTLAVVLSSLSYAGGGVYGQVQVHDIAGPVPGAGNMLAGFALIVVGAALAFGQRLFGYGAQETPA
jgi:drug/metabolite transporter (DMT)-like permease